MNRQTAVQIFSTIVILVGLGVSYFPPAENGAAIWGLVGVFFGYAMHELFGPATTPLTAVGSFTASAPVAPGQGGYASPWWLAMVAVLMIAAAWLLSGCSGLAVQWAATATYNTPAATTATMNPGAIVPPTDVPKKP